MYSESLIHTLRTNPHIKEVHFTQSGHYFLNVREHSLGTFGRLINGEPELGTRISKTVSREEILKDNGSVPSAVSETKNIVGKKKS